MKLDADLAINMFVGDADFDEVTKITDEAAEFLSEQDEILFLDGLTELSDAAVEEDAADWAESLNLKAGRS